MGAPTLDDFITGDNSGNMFYKNEFNIDYYDISNDTSISTSAANNAFSYSDMNISLYSNTNNTSNNTNLSCELGTAEKIATTLYKYYAPIVISTGSIGNILSIIVFFKTKLRKLSSSYYLAALAISDTYFLLACFIGWLDRCDMNLLGYVICCKLFTFSTYFANFCSDWFVVAFTVERFIAVLYPLKRQTMCTVRRAKIVLFGLTVMGCLHSLPFWFASEPRLEATREKYYCDVNPLYKDAMQLLNYWDSFIVFAAPFIIIAILNTWTACTVWKFATVRRSLTMQKRKDTLTKTSITTNSNNVTSMTYRHPKRQNSSCSQQSEPNYISQHHHHGCILRKQSAKRRSSNASQSKVTKMLMVVSTVFVCLNLPSCVVRIQVFLADNTRTLVLLQHFFELFFITNFGINFVLYCVSGQNFRKEVLNMFRRRSLTQREGTTQITVSESTRPSGGSSGRSSRRHQTSCWNELRDLQAKK